MVDICPPALIYIVFSITQIIIDLFKGFYNTALMKFLVMCVIGFLLNLLCIRGLDIIAWIIVFIPFVLMTVIVAMLLYIFGLKQTIGTTAANTTITNTNTTTVPVTSVPVTTIQQSEDTCQPYPHSYKHGLTEYYMAC